jgi:hypothetical protein
MEKHRFIGLLLIGMVCHVLQGQIIIRDVEHLNDLKKLPLEKMYIHHDSSLLFPGEYLLYSVYCINAYTYALSEISKIAYVELVSENGQIIFSHKLRLDKGRGQGDYFVPVDLPSGNYKLIGYTQWMKNGGLDQLFQDDLAIINPYQSDQSALLPSDEKSDSLDTVNNKAPDMIRQHTLSSSAEEIMQLLIDSTQYGKRSRITVFPKNYKGPLGYGSYSIVIRKKDSSPNGQGVTANGFSMGMTEVNRFIPQQVNDSLFLPEQLGELFWGNIVLSDTEAPAISKTVVISLPGADFQLKYATTDQNGNFFTYLNKEYDVSSAIVQLLDDDKKVYHIQIKKASPLNYGALKFKKFSVSPDMKKMIETRSVENQIENAFFMVKPDTIVSVKDNDPFIGGNPEVYELDDYTRFPTLRETLVEVVDNVWVRKVRGEESIWVRQYFEPTNEQYINLPPLVFIDGVLIPNHQEILEFNAYDIKTIRTVRDQFVIGGKEYLGMVVIETLAGNYDDQWQANTHGIKQELDPPRPLKNYFKQNYEGKNLTEKRRIPDFRRELLWVPNYTIDGKEQPLECYASDILGDYEIVLEGFTSYGKPISIKKTFTVVE